MNREIKFRCWNPENKNMTKPVSLSDIAHENEWVLAHNTSDYIFMQFTGLLDKNGKEIYEHDILKQFGNQKPFKAEFFNSAWRANRLYILGSEIKPEVLEVIGNIYENPELVNLH